MGRASKLKRVIDIVVAVTGLLLVSPLLLVLVVLCAFDLGWPVIFVQERPGLDGIPFRLWKFRTMSQEVSDKGQLLPDNERLTRFGAFLRRWSLDELPELVNVLVGDMSLVGPRPLLMEYLHLYDGRQAKRHLMKPGLTGLAQVSGRNDLSWEEKLELDVYYVEHWSLALDVQILIKTVWQVISGQGVSAKGHATMPRFTGNRNRVQGL